MITEIFVGRQSWKFFGCNMYFNGRLKTFGLKLFVKRYDTELKIESYDTVQQIDNHFILLPRDKKMFEILMTSKRLL